MRRITPELENGGVQQEIKAFLPKLQFSFQQQKAFLL